MEKDNLSTGHFGSGTNIYVSPNITYVIKQAETATGASSITLINNDLNFTYLADESEIPNEAKIEYVIINLQLDYWIEAKNLFKKIISKGYVPTYADFDKIILYLVTSLSKLFGRNWTENDKNNYNEVAKKHNAQLQKNEKKLKYYRDNNTPSLIEFIRDCYPLSKPSFNLKKENLKLYESLERMVFFHNDNVKHYEDMKELNIFSIKIADVRRFMDTTQEVWKWYLGKYYNNEIPEIIIREFQEQYNNM